MNLKRQLNKPEYFFRPKQILQRLGSSKQETVCLPWAPSQPFSFNPQETIGRSLRTYGLYDLCLTEALFRTIQPADLCVDVGANIGYCSSLMSARGGEVHSFEPHPELFLRLQQNLGSKSQVQLHQKALSAEEGELPLYVPKSFQGNEGVCSLEPMGEESTEIRVPVGTLDQMFSKRVIHQLKIDVEGHEESVLLGAKELLASQNIHWIFFEDFLHEKSPVVTLLESHGYVVRRLVKGFWGPQLVPVSESRRIPLWEPPNFVATTSLEKMESVLSEKKWRVLSL